MIAEMSKLRLVGLKSDYKEILDILTASKYFEYKPTGNEKTPSHNVEELLLLQSKLAFAIDYLDRQNNEAIVLKKGSKNVDFDYEPSKKSGMRPIVDFETIIGIEGKKDEIFKAVDELEQISFRRAEIKSEIAAKNDALNSYMQYSRCPLAFDSIADTQKTAAFLFYSKLNDVRLPEDEISLFAEYYSGYPYGTICAVVCLKADVEKLNALVAGFERCTLTGKTNASVIVEELRAEILNLQKEDFELFKRALTFSERLLEFKILYDRCGIAKEHDYIEANSTKTTYTFLLEGWIPSDAAQEIVQRIDEKFSIFYELSIAVEEEIPPTLMVNNGVVEPFETITLMYTPPAYREQDPNSRMAFWYLLIFGMMMGDVIYGILLTLGCFLLLKIKPMEREGQKLFKVFGYCGIASAAWGVVFDSYFGFTLLQLSGGAVDFGWFNPLDKPMMMLAVSLLVGMLQLMHGYIIKFIAMCKKKKVFSAIFDAGFMLMVLTAISLLAANIFVGILQTGQLDMSGQFLSDEAAAFCSQAGLILLAVAAVGIFFTAGRESKSIGGKLGGGLNGVYGLVNLISDILSYCRIFGLGLAGAAIGYAFNMLIETLFWGGSVIMIPISIVVLIVLHIFNLGIGLLGAYVHNARLQMLEFYGKFLTGDGRLFEPLGSQTKYVRY